MKRILAIISAFIAAAAIMAGALYYAATPGVEKDVDSDPAAYNGITDTEILIGSSSALTGSTAFLGTEYIKGSLAYINKVNENGGVHGRKIRVISYDDQYDPPKTVLNTQKLIVEDKVFILFDYVGTPTSVKILDIVEEADIPVLGLFTGAEELRTPLRPNIFNVRASYYQEADSIIEYLVGRLGLKRIAVFYQDDAFGITGLRGTEIALNEYGLEPVDRASYKRGTINVEEGLDKISKADPEAIVMVGTYKPLAKFVKLYKESGKNPYFHTLSFVGADAYAAELSAYGINQSERIIVTEVVPDPYEISAIYLDCIKDYRDDIARYFPGDIPNYVGLEGYVNAKILVKALEDSGRDLSRERFKKSLESLKDYRIGLGVGVNYGPEDHQAFDRVHLSSLKEGRFLAF